MASSWNEGLLPPAVAELRRRIAELGLTQTQAAELMGVSQPYLNRVLHAREGSSWSRVLEMLTALGAKVDMAIRYDGRSQGEMRLLPDRASSAGATTNEKPRAEARD